MRVTEAPIIVLDLPEAPDRIAYFQDLGVFGETKRLLLHLRLLPRRGEFSPVDGLKPRAALRRGPLLGRVREPRRV